MCKAVLEELTCSSLPQWMKVIKWKHRQEGTSRWSYRTSPQHHLGGERGFPHLTAQVLHLASPPKLKTNKQTFATYHWLLSNNACWISFEKILTHMLQSFHQPPKFWRRSKHQKLKNSTVTSKKTGCGLYLWSQPCARFTTGKETCSLWVGSSLGNSTSNAWCIVYRQLHWIINSDYENTFLRPNEREYKSLKESVFLWILHSEWFEQKKWKLDI